jgi:uncharacterized protein YbbK (DUF523 family)
VTTNEGRDVSEAFVRGAEAALELAQRYQIRVAVLKDGSPSCGSAIVYDGTFTGTKVDGEGVTAALLRANGIHVFSEQELERAAACLDALETGA